MSFSDHTSLRTIYRVRSTMYPTKLENLQPELLLLISKYLSSTDASWLALCSRHFMTRSFHDILNKSFPPGRTGQPDEEVRIEFLTRLCRDLPQYHACFACLRLHLWQHIDSPSPSFNFRSCYHTINDDYMHVRLYACYQSPRLWPPPKLPVLQIQLYARSPCMRRFYFGPSYGIPTESLRYTEVAVLSLVKHKQQLCGPPKSFKILKEWEYSPLMLGFVLSPSTLPAFT
jgi:hypothetical protein